MSKSPPHVGGTGNGLAASYPGRRATDRRDVGVIAAETRRLARQLRPAGPTPGETVRRLPAEAQREQASGATVGGRIEAPKVQTRSL